jgi:hypothetical protein
MNSVRIVEDAMSVESLELHSCLNELLGFIRGQFQTINPELAITQRSESFKKAIADSLKSIKGVVWEKNSVFQNPSLNDVPAIFKLDGQAECDGTCNSMHKINFVLCLNNRESIGTNFLKLEIAALDLIRNSRSTSIFDENILGVLITLDSNVLELGKWDASYANANEYKFAYKHAYKNLLRSNILALQFHFV